MRGRHHAGQGEGRHVARAAAGFTDLSHAFFLNLVDTDDGVHGNIAALDRAKLVLELLLGGVDDQLAALTEYELLDLDDAAAVEVEHLEELRELVGGDQGGEVRLHRLRR